MNTTPAPASRAATALALGLLLALGGCGGGGSSSAGSPAAVSAPVSSPPSTGTTATAVSSACNAPDFSAAAVAVINRYRAGGADCRTLGTFGPTTAVLWNAQLAQAATTHSLDMVAANYAGHTGSDGSNQATRVAATGYPLRSDSPVGETIAVNAADVDAVIALWMGSDAHCAILMTPSFTAVGQACAPGSASNTYTSYWTLNLSN